MEKIMGSNILHFDELLSSFQSDLCQVAAAHEEKRELAQSQKSGLSDILNERNRPTWSKASLNQVYLVSRQ